MDDIGHQLFNIKWSISKVDVILPDNEDAQEKSGVFTMAIIDLKKI